MIKPLIRQFRLARKGFSKPVFMVAAITLAILFVVAYYTATTGWMSQLGDNFNQVVSSQQSQAIE